MFPKLLQYATGKIVPKDCEPRGDTDRTARLKAALRANLAKRKERDRAHAATAGETDNGPRGD